MRKVRRGLLIILGVILLGTAGGYLYFFQFGGLKRIVISKINDAVGKDSPFKVSIGNIRGSFLAGVVLEDVIVNYHDSLAVSEILSIERIMARYSLANLWRKQYLFDELYVDSLSLVAIRDSAGNLLIPLPTGGGAAASAPLILGVEDLRFSKTSLKLISEDDTLAVENLTLVGSVEAGEKLYSTEIKHLSFLTSPQPLYVSDCSGKATFSDGNLVFQDLNVRHGDTRLKLSGVIALDELNGTVQLAIDHLDIAEISSVIGGKLKGLLDVNGTVAFKDSQVSGQVSIGGNFLFADLGNLFADFSFADKILTVDTLYGTILGDCSVDGKASVDFSGPTETYHLDANIKNFSLDQIVENSFASDLTGHIRMNGQSFKNADLLLSLQVDMFESTFDDYPMHGVTGEINITTDSLSFPSPLRVDYFENSFFVTGVIDYDEDMSLEIDARLSNLDRWRGKLFIDQPGGRGTGWATLTGRTSDPDLEGWFVSDSLWLYGLVADSCFTTFSIDEFLTGRQGFVRVIVLDGAAWQVPYDSGLVRLRLDSNLVFIDSVNFTSQYSTLAARGRLDQGPYPQLLTFDTLALSVLERDFYNRSELKVAIDSSGFDFLQTSIGKEAAALTADGRVNYDETMDLLLTGVDIPIAPWLHLFDQELELDGYLSGKGNLGGSFVAPVFDVEGSIDSMVYRNLLLGDLFVDANYRDQLVTIDSLLILSSPGRYHATGTFYANLSFAADNLERLPELPFDLSVQASDTRFDLVSLFLPSVEDMSGDFLADFQLSGTPAKPHLDGEAYIKNGRLKYFDLADTVKTDSAGVTMTDNRIVIDHIETYVYDKKKRRNSYATVEGELIVKALDSLYYDLEISIPREMPFKYELDDIEGRVEGDIQVTGDTPPLVTGDLTMIYTRYRAEFSTEKTGSPLMIALSGENTWDLNLNVDILSNYWIKNRDIDAEFSGFMNLIREDGQYRFVGELEILKGRGFLFEKTFRIQPNSRVTFEDIEYPNPRLDIVATTRIPVTSFEGEEERSEVELSIHVGGTLENPEFDVEEGAGGDSDFSEEDILPLILANYYGAESGSPGAFEERVSQFVSSQVSQIGTRRLGVETFEIDPTYEGRMDLRRTRVTLGVQTTSSLYLYGRTPVTFDRGQEVGFEYRFNRAFLFEGQRDEDELYHLNLKLHWEF